MSDDSKSAENSQAAVRKKILLVDDDREIVESMRIALDASGFEIIVARDGNQGLAMAEREDPDLVILDMMMPKRSGFLVLEKLRRTRPGAVARDHDHGQRRQPAQGLRRNAGRRRLHPQALRHGPPAGERDPAAEVLRVGYCPSRRSDEAFQPG